MGFRGRFARWHPKKFSRCGYISEVGRAARSSRLEPPSRRHREPSQRHARATHCPAGAYWEAGFAEGLGKPVIYICRAKEGDAEKKTHFDANHRHTVRWDLSTLDETAKKLKAVIRNTLLGDAKQED